jgi:erythronate-4-phosphate dehydrogenase
MLSLFLLDSVFCILISMNNRKIVCCSNMPYVREVFSLLGQPLVKDGRIITGEDIRDAEIMAIRSTTKVSREMLEGSKVRFVGTATIGTDHMDKAYMDSVGIKWCYAPGCNANSVSEYFTTAILRLATRHNISLEGKTIGVIGVGNVGSLVVKKAAALGMRVLRNDPPREREAAKRKAQSGKREEKHWASLDEVLKEADIITLHVPLTKTGQDATYQMAGRKFFEKMKPGCIFFNCARGGVVNTSELLAAMDHKIVSNAVIDTWEGEPVFRTDLLKRVDIGTPHIAGHSFEGKVYGTVMVYQAACKFLGVEATWTPDNLWPPPIVPEIEADATGLRDEEILWKIVSRVYDIEGDDKRLRDGSGEDDKERSAHFDRLRSKYPIRREFRFTKVSLGNARPELRKKVSELGFQIDLKPR